MVSLQAKTLENKINLFFQTADVNKDGRLSEDEIFDLCKICLSKYLPDDKFLDNICVFYTRLIFRTVDVDIDDEIPL
jgi:Ca2+-binding EF-hand superfamily protein